LREPAFWTDNPDVFGCEEEDELYFHEEKCTWFGLSKSGKYALMTDVRDGVALNEQLNNSAANESEQLDGDGTLEENDGRKTARKGIRRLNGRKKLTPDEQTERIKQLKYDTRKLLVRDYLQNADMPPIAYMQKIATRSRKLDGFNLLLGDLDGLYFFSNRDPDKVAYEVVHGEYTIDDTPGLDTSKDTQFPKLLKGKRTFIDFIANIELRSDHIDNQPAEQSVTELQDGEISSRPSRSSYVYDSNALNTFFRILEDEERFARPEGGRVPPGYNGLSADWEDRLSSLFVSTPVYSTRSSVVVIIQPPRRRNKKEPMSPHSSSTGSPRSITRERSTSFRSRSGSGQRSLSTQQPVLKTVMKYRKYQVSFIHRTYDHTAMEEQYNKLQSEKEEKGNASLSLEELVGLRHRKKIYTSKYQYFEMIKTIAKQIEDKNDGVTAVDSDSDASDESDVEPITLESNPRLNKIKPIKSQ
jgi:uncharacterized protein with NRDE domain/predicted CopG family antitoxin